MNDQGLAYGKFNTLPWKLPIKSFHGKIFRPILELENYCLEHCSTVEEVVEIYSKYNLFYMFSYQSFFVDKNGNSIIIEGDNIIYKEGDYQIVTNFLQSRTNPDEIYCRRYLTATDMLENMTELTVDYFTSICIATHSNRSFGAITQNSQVFNLSSGEVYYYNHHQFDKYVKFNLTEEFQKEEQLIYMPPLFKPENNSPPSIPQRPSVYKTKGLFDRRYKFVTNTVDIDNDIFYVKWDYGDGTISEWKRPYNSTEIISNFFMHTYKRMGTYNVRVKARDIYGQQSDWSEPLIIKSGLFW